MADSSSVFESGTSESLRAEESEYPASSAIEITPGLTDVWQKLGNYAQQKWGQFCARATLVGMYITASTFGYGPTVPRRIAGYDTPSKFMTMYDPDAAHYLTSFSGPPARPPRMPQRAISASRASAPSRAAANVAGAPAWMLQAIVQHSPSLADRIEDSSARLLKARERVTQQALDVASKLLASRGRGMPSPYVSIRLDTPKGVKSYAAYPASLLPLDPVYWLAQGITILEISPAVHDNALIKAYASQSRPALGA